MDLMHLVAMISRIPKLVSLWSGLSCYQSNRCRSELFSSNEQKSAHINSAKFGTKWSCRGNGPSAPSSNDTKDSKTALNTIGPFLGPEI